MKFTRAITSCFLFFGSIFNCAAQSNPIKEKSLLWRISGHHLSKPSYLFGTIHMICKDDFIWTGKMREALSNSDDVCFEMNINDSAVITAATTALVENLFKKLMDSGGDEQMKLLRTMLADSVNAGMGGQPDPMALQSMMKMPGMNCDNPISYEDSIMKMALAEKKVILGMEKPEEQVAVMETIPIDSLLSMLLESGLNKDTTGTADDAEMMIAYKTQDLPRLYELISGNKSNALDMGIFLDDRNKKWISRMTDKMNGASVFFAVGAGHLAGEQGVINLLRHAGYHVEPVR